LSKYYLSYILDICHVYAFCIPHAFCLVKPNRISDYHDWARYFIIKTFDRERERERKKPKYKIFVSIFG